MKPLAWFAALFGGTIGAAAWAAISRLTGLEIGYAAWGIGLLVGYAAKYFGGKGKTTAVSCALVSLASILGGKGLSTADAIRQAFHAELPQAYENHVREAQAYHSDASDAEIAKFMIENNYSEHAEATAIQPDDIKAFRTNVGTSLEDFAKKMPALSEWANSPEVQEMKAYYLSLKNVTSSVKQSLNAIDLIFGGLGVVTAYQVVANQGDDGVDEDEDEDEQDEDGGDE